MDRMTAEGSAISISKAFELTGYKTIAHLR
jgi:hypothetical protein